jgi:3',5'-cyclic-AMP phosphodiesterase
MSFISFYCIKFSEVRISRQSTKLSSMSSQCIFCIHQVLKGRDGLAWAGRVGMYILFFTSILLTVGCDTLEFSPNQRYDRDSPVGLNQKNLQKLLANPIDDTVTIAFVGDSQRFYSELERFIDRANTIPEIDFILLAGDISDFGLLQEQEWVVRRLSKLRKPYFGVIGNHDLVANGEAVFERMFGPLHDSFVYGGIKFVSHNTNGLEYKRRRVPDLNWLQKELTLADSSIQHVVTVSHVPPFSAPEFTPDLVEPYTALLGNTPKLLLSLHGHIHQHKDFYPYEDGVRYVTSFAFNQSSFVLLKITKGQVFKTIVTY